ncbi:MAG: hypothetical protein NVS3B26_30750 [Mycobacteriales bacterium]
MFTVTFAMHEQSGRDRAETMDYWRTTHGPIVAKVPGVQRYVQQHALAAPDGPPPFLGLATRVFSNQDACGAAAGSPEFAAALADVPNSPTSNGYRRPLWRRSSSSSDTPTGSQVLS